MSRMEDRIRKLCAQLLTKKNDEDLMATLVELRDALHEHIERLRQRFAEYPVLVERRVRNQTLAAITQSPPKSTKDTIQKRRVRAD
jgi:hypothetical protein